jgi:hypothetical protein
MASLTYVDPSSILEDMPVEVGATSSINSAAAAAVHSMLMMMIYDSCAAAGQIFGIEKCLGSQKRLH